MKKGKLQGLKEKLDALHVGDVKSAYVPFALGDIMVGKIPMSTMGDKILVVSDVGLLLAVMKRVKRFQFDTSNVTFLCHTEKLRKYAQGLGIKTWFAPYNELDTFFREERVQLDNDEIYSLKEKDMKHFDVVCGNAPFQSDAKEREKGSGTGSAKSIWQHFVEKAFDLLRDNGHLLFVTPNNWNGGVVKKCSQYKDVQALMFENGIKWFIDCRSPVDYFDVVGKSITIGAWHVQKTGVEHESILGKLRITASNLDATPILEKYFSICHKDETIKYHGRGCTAEAKRGNSYVDNCDEKHPYRVANTSSKVRRNIFGWSSKKNPCYDDKKVVVSDSGAFVAGYDGGTYGIGEHTACYIVDSEDDGHRLETFLRLPIINYIVRQFMPEASFGFPIGFFAKLPKQILDFEWDEKNWKESAKQVFGFTNEEIEKIEKC